MPLKAISELLGREQLFFSLLEFKMQIEFNATKRTLQGTGASRRLRVAGSVPAII